MGDCYITRHTAFPPKLEALDLHLTGGGAADICDPNQWYLPGADNFAELLDRCLYHFARRAITIWGVRRLVRSRV